MNRRDFLKGIGKAAAACGLTVAVGLPDIVPAEDVLLDRAIPTPKPTKVAWNGLGESWYVLEYERKKIDYIGGDFRGKSVFTGESLPVYESGDFVSARKNNGEIYSEGFVTHSSSSRLEIQSPTALLRNDWKFVTGYYDPDTPITFSNNLT